MAGIYLDASALGRALLAEPEARAIRATIADFETRWSSELLVVELRRLAVRESIEAVAEVLLDGIGLLVVRASQAAHRVTIGQRSREDPGLVPAKTVLQLAREGRLPHLRIGRHVRFVRVEREATLSRWRAI